MELTKTKAKLAVRMFRNGHSVGYVANALRLSFVDVITIRRDMPPPKRPAPRKMNPRQYGAVRKLRKCGFTIDGLMKNYSLSREEVMHILRTRPTGSGIAKGRAELKAEGYGDDAIRAAFGE